MRRVARIVVLSLVLAASCAKMAERGEMAPAPMLSVDTSSAGSAVRSAEAGLPLTPVALPKDRILVKTGSLALIVADAQAALGKLDEVLKEHGAFVAGRQSEAVIPPREILSPSEVVEMTLTIKVEARRFDEFLAAVKEIGSYTREQVSVEDVTMQYVDLEARLANQKKVEERLLGHLNASTQQLKDIIEVEKELARVREQIDSLTAQFKALREQVTFSTLTLSISVRPGWVPPPERTFFQVIADKFLGSLEALAEAAKGTLVVAIAAAPWVVVLGGLFYGFYRLLKRLRRKKQ
jgi:uncharacterized coiled-coil protein SlyX